MTWLAFPGSSVRSGYNEEEFGMGLKDKIDDRRWVEFVDDERDLGNGIPVSLADGYYFRDDPGFGVLGSETLSEA